MQSHIVHLQSDPASIEAQKMFLFAMNRSEDIHILTRGKISQGVCMKPAKSCLLLEQDIKTFSLRKLVVYRI